jgi:hypothetical protein
LPDAEPSRDLGLGEPLEKPASDKLFLGLVEFAATSRGGVVLQSVEAVLLVASFPATLGSHRVAKGTSQVLLGSELTLPEHDGDVAEVGLIVQGDTIDGFMATADDAVAVAFDKPQTWVEEGAVVGRRVRR